MALSTSAAGDRDFATRAGVNAAAILVFVNATIMVVFYMWIIQVLTKSGWWWWSILLYEAAGYEVRVGLGWVVLGPCARICILVCACLLEM